MIDVAAPTAAPEPANVSRKTYSASGDSPNALLLLLATLGVAYDVDLGHIFFPHYVSQFSIWMGRHATKWHSKAFAFTGDVVASSIALANFDPRCLDLLWNSVNVPSTYDIDTTLETTPTPILLDPMVYGDAGDTSIRV